MIEELKALLDQGGVALDQEAADRLRAYHALLLEWNARMDLTNVPEEEMAVRHYGDSLLPLARAAWFPQGAKLIDVGTGAGFPGMVLKILRPETELTLLDSLDKRLRFLSTVCGELGFADVQCLHARAEEAPPELRQSFDVACSRAVARLNLLAELCLPFVKVGGVFAAMKGPELTEELREAEKGIRLLGGEVERVAEYAVPGTELRHNAVLIRKVSETPKKYPRKWGQMKKNPL